MIITVPKSIDMKTVECNCGKDDNGFKPFWLHALECPRYFLIAGGFKDTVFNDSEANALKEKFINNATS